uniref:Charged multivesicular body protein 7 n=2 Tax=Eptatretus burgeri TaxID=7764 RepID=A0A8C4PX18_EPTBU
MTLSVVMEEGPILGSEPWLPPEWQDDRRMAFLSSALQPPSGKGFAAKSPASGAGQVAFWSSLMVSSSRARGQAWVSRERLVVRFRRKGAPPPHCLGAVMDAMERQGDLVQASKFTGAWTSRAWQTLSWALCNLASVTIGWESSYPPPDMVFVIPDVVKGLGTMVLSLVHTAQPKALHGLAVEAAACTDREPFLTWAEVEALTAGTCCDALTLTLTLQQLQQEGRATVHTEAGETVVKFCKSGSSIVKPVSEEDLAVLRLRHMATVLETRSEALSDNNKKLKLEAKSLHRTGDKQKALGVMRLRRRGQDRERQLLTQIDSVASLLEGLDKAKVNTMVAGVLAAGSRAVDMAHQQGPRLEEIDTLTSKLQELMSEEEEISKALSEDFSGTDMDELEKELVKLVAEESGEGEVLTPAKEADALTVLDQGANVSPLLNDADLDSELAKLSLEGIPRLSPEHINKKKLSEQSLTLNS